ncbi:MFS transporter [Halobacillus salinus]|uniref:MFS transporter n=1 Tax=Halobacillus salinus TaxID=192814 RepID=A0A4Z0GZT1_9BACI|nr:MFS transporter [Halobacillus salinus]TGB03688.1 MFS transporter [Halobacillus salinus]
MKFNRNYVYLLSGQSLANIGDVLYIVSIISAIFVTTGSATAASFVPFTITSSMFLSSILTPLLIGKVNLKWLLAGSQMAKTCLMVFLAFLVAEVSESNYMLLFLVIAAIALLDGCANPIRQTLIPHYVESEQLVRANGFAETVTQTIQTVMWFVGSLLLTIMGAVPLVWLVVLIFSISSILLCFLEPVEKGASEDKDVLGQVQDGWWTLYRTPVLRKLAAVETLETMAGTVWIAAILYVFVSEALHVGEAWWGFLNGSFFVGLIIGSVFCVRYSSLMDRNMGTMMLIGSVAGFIVTVAFSFTSHPWLALALSLLIGVSGQIKNIPQQTVIQTSVPKEKLSTVYTSLGAIGTGVFGVSSLLVGAMADLFGVRTVFLLSGILLGLASMILYRNNALFVKNVES